MSQTIELILKSPSSFSVESSSVSLKHFLVENGIESRGPYKGRHQYIFEDEVRVKYFVRSFWLSNNSLEAHREAFISMIEVMPSEIKLEMVITDE